MAAASPALPALNLFRYEGFQPLPPEYAHMPASERRDRTLEAKKALGDRCLILGHNYQNWDVNQFADLLGDSYLLSVEAARSRAELIVFCGVTFMAETAEILTGGRRTVVIPSLDASCPMAGMAELVQVEAAWKHLTQHAPSTVPVTYMNSYADLKAWTGRQGGAVCTSSNAQAVVAWALERGEKVLFLPDQHLGRNVAFELGYRDPADCVVWNPWAPAGGVAPDALARARFVLWQGFCQVHERFKPEHVRDARARHPDAIVAVHPECRREVVAMADRVGSTQQLIDMVRTAPDGTTWVIGTEINLVRYLQMLHPGKRIEQLCGEACLDCKAMRQIDPRYLLFVLESYLQDQVVNRVQVPADDRADARVALDRMIQIASAGPSR